MNSATITAGRASSNTSKVLSAANSLRGRFRTVRSYGQFVIANALMDRSVAKPRAVVDLDSSFPDIHDRRYFFLVLQTLLDAGYHVDVVWKISFSHFRQLYRTYEALVVRLKGLRVVSHCPQPSASTVLFTNKPGRDAAEWKKVIEIDCDVLARRQFENELRMPYFMHPEQYKRAARKTVTELRESSRELCIFFSGNVAEEYYCNSLPGNKLNRFEIVQALRTLAGVVFPENESEFHEMFSRSGNWCVVHDRRNFAVSDDEWLAMTARCDFFLCLPGSRMPMCHNVIEAMAVGTIPILNYGEWFDPPLKHGETCIEFNTLEDLRGRVAEVLNLDVSAVERLRENVIKYYEDHLSPAGFRKKLEDFPSDRIKLVVNTAYPWETETMVVKAL